MNLEKPIQ
ncbi:unnamed protein product, partial [Allacma fusca]